MKVDTLTVDGVTYFSLIASDGWPTGPCPTADKAIERLLAYEHGQEVSEAAPQQASRAQMTAFLAWAEEAGLRDGGELRRSIEDARHHGLHSEQWVRASRAFVRMVRSLPVSVTKAGGARIRRVSAEPSRTRGVNQ